MDSEESVEAELDMLAAAGEEAAERAAAEPEISHSREQYALCEECSQIIPSGDLTGGTPREEPPNQCPDCGAAVSGPYRIRRAE